MAATSKNVPKEVGTIGFEAKLRLNPFKSCSCDPTFASGPALARFMQAEKFMQPNGGIAMRVGSKPKRDATMREFPGAKHHRGEISACGQESNATTRRLGITYLAVRGIEADTGKEHADAFRSVQHSNLRADTSTHVSVKPKPRCHFAGL